MPMHKRYENIKPVGSKHFTNTFGVLFYEPDEVDKYKENCDYITALHNGEYAYNFHKNMVHYTTSGRAYIRKGSLRIYLDEVMKVY